MKRWPLVASFLLFLLLCASIAYWGLQLFKPPLRPVAAPPRTAGADVRPEAAATLFGGRAGKVAVASNYQLRGVILSGTAEDSIAILSADGKPAQAVRVGSELQPGVVVKEVHREYALLSEGGAIKRVELPENAPSQGQLSYATAPARVTPSRAVPPLPAQPQSQPQTRSTMPAPAVVVNPSAVPAQNSTGAAAPAVANPLPVPQPAPAVQQPQVAAPATVPATPAAAPGQQSGTVPGAAPGTTPAVPTGRNLFNQGNALPGQ